MEDLLSILRGHARSRIDHVDRDRILLAVQTYQQLARPSGGVRFHRVDGIDHQIQQGLFDVDKAYRDSTGPA